MPKKILITGATDGIGLETAKLLAAAGHSLLLHGRSARKMRAAVSAVSSASPSSPAPDTFLADLSDLSAVDTLASAVLARHPALDVLINNAGVFARAPAAAAVPSDVDIHLCVNTVAPYRLTRLLAGALGRGARVVNLSSAAQSPVRLGRLTGDAAGSLAPFEAYAMSKLALTMWSRALATEWASDGLGRVVVAVNPGSMLGTKMVKQGFGVDGGDVMIGANVLVRAAVGDDFSDANGKYFNNDARSFASPHRDATDAAKNGALVHALDDIIALVASK